MADNNNDAFNFGHFDNLFGPRNPPPTRPNRKLQIVVSKTEIATPCSGCLQFGDNYSPCRSPGTLTCSQCHAISYCGRECQKAHWKNHKADCKNIKKFVEETKEAGAVLVSEFGDEDTFFKTPVVKNGCFHYIHIDGEQVGDGPFQAKSSKERYMLARLRLVEAYRECGAPGGRVNSRAFKLAAENILDTLCLSYRGAEGEHIRHQYAGWLVAGRMDQEALNYLSYFHHRKNKGYGIPYLDMQTDEDIESDECMMLVKPPDKLGRDLALSDQYGQWFHDFMLIALLKLKRRQKLAVEKRMDEVNFGTFMMGTHTRVGAESVALTLRGNSLVIDKIKSFCLDGLDHRITNLTGHINDILALVHEDNPLIIPGIIDRNSIPDEEPYHIDDLDEDDDFNDDDDDDYNPHGDDRHDACWAFGNYGYAWNMTHSYARYLRLFIQTGKIPNMKFPHEGYLQAAVDVDPTKQYGDETGLFVIPRNVFHM